MKAVCDGEYRFVRRRDVAEYKSKGWVISSYLDDTHHGLYSVIMKEPYKERNDGQVD